jgi:hypothetical protein
MAGGGPVVEEEEEEGAASSTRGKRKRLRLLLLLLDKDSARPLSPDQIETIKASNGRSVTTYSRSSRCCAT